MRMPFRGFGAGEQPVPEETTPAALANEKEVGVATERPPSSHEETDGSDTESIDKDAQRGVQQVEAMTKVWSARDLYLAYALIWIIYLFDALQQGTTSILTPYVVSTFDAHGLTPTVNVASSIIGGVSKLTLAKVLDVWGRPQGYLLTLLFMIFGLILMAVCRNVETYAAAQVFYWIGYNGFNYCVTVFIADTSALKNRGLMLAYTSSPYLITVWITGRLANDILFGPGFRWGFGIFAIITPFITLPLWWLFTHNQNKAKKMGILVRERSGRTVLQSIRHYFFEFDVICLILTSAGFSLFLLPFSIESYQRYGWRDPLTISFIVVGIVLLATAVVWEKYWSPVKFMPWELLKDRTVLGACILAAVLFIEYYIWTAYFTSFLQVVLRLNLTTVGYISNIYTLGSCFFSIPVGLFIRWTGRFKWITLLFGVPATILSIGLLIALRRPSAPLAGIIVVEILYAFAGGACVICEQVAVMAAAAHQHVSVVLAIEGMWTSIGGAIGSTVAAAIWASVYPVQLKKLLPAESQGNFVQIYGNLSAQIEYPVGSPTHDAIVEAYGHSLKIMFIAATAITVIGLGATAMWRDIKVKDFKQTKGRVI